MLYKNINSLRIDNTYISINNGLHKIDRGKMDVNIEITYKVFI